LKYDWIDKHLLSKVGVYKDYKKEWNWTRYLLKGKVIAATFTDESGRKVITLKCEPLFGEQLRKEYSDITPGYYMNKTHWNSVYLDGVVSDDILKEMIYQSYTLIFNKLSKKAQKEILMDRKFLTIDFI